MAKRRNKAPEKPSTAWQGTYGDMITLMLCFFVMLYNPSEVDVTQLATITQSLQMQETESTSGGMSLSAGRLSDLGNNINSLPSLEKGKSLGLAKKKAVKLLYFTLELITGAGEKSGEYDFKTIMFQEIKRKCKEELINYGSTKAAEGLIKLINENLSKGIKDNIIGIDLQEKHDIYILNDILKNRDNYKYYILEKIETFLSGSEELTQLFNDQLKRIEDKFKQSFS